MIVMALSTDGNQRYSWMNPLNPLGVKGAGEGGTIPAPAAIISAVEDALSAFGVRFTEMPLTPDRIVDALRKAGAYETLA
jgi:carbon-monoxide dehydrogenase large subunit